MNTSNVVGIVVGVLVLVALVALVIGLRRRDREKRLAADREEAQRLRTEAESAARQQVTEARVEAQEAEAKAERARLEAQRAQEEAAQARQGLEVEEARHEDRLRTADRLDPDLPERSSSGGDDAGPSPWQPREERPGDVRP